MAKEQENCEELKSHLSSSNSPLVLRKIKYNSQTSVYCDISTNHVRPFVPESLRQLVFKKMHNLSHPGTNITVEMVRERFVWPGMNKQIRGWVKNCLQCQKCKVHRHTKSIIEGIPVVARFKHVHIDLIGPMPSSRGFNYCVTMRDRFTRWSEAVPIVEATALQVAIVFIHAWVARFGVPEEITSDLGRQFESTLFGELMRLLGVKHLRTTPYHPQANGMIERWHRTLKSSIMCRANASWSDELPLILLAHRNSINEDIGASSAQLVYGTSLAMPGQFFEHQPHIKFKADFVTDLMEAMQSIQPASSSHHGNAKVFVPNDLEKTSFVFVRNDKIRPSLCPPYTGPHKVLDRGNKYMTINMNGRSSKISIDRLKPAHLLTDSETCTKERNNMNELKETTKTTKSGRTIRKQVRFAE